ncbi:unnamed protein product, partial [Mesorhabditis belari]|uniref:Glucosylceramidase n=1 Tax=Mesorhabditis belari TaxID=2138241 RepID=A0AAF3FC56_9BILA
MLFFQLISTLLYTAESTNGKDDCVKRFTNPKDKTSMVCVCNTQQCHTFPRVKSLSGDSAYFYETTASGLRFEKSEIKNNTKNEWDKMGFRLKVITTERFQEIIGFGGAMTDAAAINIDRLDNEELEEILLHSYFGDQGIEYNVIRIPIASCDFSTREYSYLNTPGDFSLNSFHLAEEDQWKIKFIRRAQKMARLPIKNFGSPWSAPAWMKTTGHMKGGGKLLEGEKYSKTYAEYFVRFIEDYTAQGIPIWGVTVQNEPSLGEDEKYGFQAMFFPPKDQSDFVANHLGPTIAKSKVANRTLIMIHDDFRGNLPEWADITLANPKTDDFVSGIAVHWYGDRDADPMKLTQTKEKHPRKFILGTEACTGPGIDLGSFSRGERYAEDIIEDLQHDVSGWVDWNLALDLQGGPNWVSNFVDSPIIVNHTAKEFYLQPMFYAMGHFSKFIKPGAKRVSIKMQKVKDVQGIAFINQDGTVAVVVQNKGDFGVKISIEDERGKQYRVTLQQRSINTLVYK